jgi:hypothetical protein
VRRVSAFTAVLVAVVVLSLVPLGLGPTPRPAAAAVNLITIYRTTSYNFGYARPGQTIKHHVSCQDNHDSQHPVAVGFAELGPPVYFVQAAFVPNNIKDRLLGRITVINNGRDTHGFTAFALCLEASVSDVTYVRTDTTVSAGSTGNVRAACPEGTKWLTGVGGKTTSWGELGPRRAPVYGYQPYYGWRTGLNNTLTGARQEGLFAQASCAFSPRLRVERVTSTSIAAPPGITSGSAVCPKGTKVAGGGWNIPSTARLDLTRSMPRAGSATIADRWIVGVANNTSTTSSFRVFAVCVSLA